MHKSAIFCMLLLSACATSAVDPDNMTYVGQGKCTDNISRIDKTHPNEFSKGDKQFLDRVRASHVNGYVPREKKTLYINEFEFDKQYNAYLAECYAKQHEAYEKVKKDKNLDEKSRKQILKDMKLVMSGNIGIEDLLNNQFSTYLSGYEGLEIPVCKARDEYAEEIYGTEVSNLPDLFTDGKNVICSYNNTIRDNSGKDVQFTVVSPGGVDCMEKITIAMRAARGQSADEIRKTIKRHTDNSSCILRWIMV